MPYNFDWVDDDSRILSIRLFDPLNSADMVGLAQAIWPIVEVESPLFVLLNILELDFKSAFSNATSAFDGEPMPDITHHLNRSRLAIVGGGSPVALIINLAQQVAEQSDVVRAFTHEDQALTWLREQARLLST